MHECFESQHPGCSFTTSCGCVGSLTPSETSTVSALQGSMRAHVLSNIHPCLRSLCQEFWVPTFYCLKISNFEKTTTKMIFIWFNAAYFFSTSTINLSSALLRFLTSLENTSEQWLLWGWLSVLLEAPPVHCFVFPESYLILPTCSSNKQPHVLFKCILTFQFNPNFFVIVLSYCTSVFSLETVEIKPPVIWDVSECSDTRMTKHILFVLWG